MGLFSKLTGSSDEYRDAQAELECVARRDGTESDDYTAANQRVAETEPWYRRDRA